MFSLRAKGETRVGQAEDGWSSVLGEGNLMDKDLETRRRLAFKKGEWTDATGIR